ncbi:hypothetical protein LINPERHAP2_LOCUS16561 [Linum perenne]
MEQERPGCGVKADPNIISRCKTLNEKFLALQELRGLSSSGWYDTKKMFIIGETSYADYVAVREWIVWLSICHCDYMLYCSRFCFLVQKHSHCAKLNWVPFPSYDGLAKVFDKVRATGESAIGMEELRKDVLPLRYKIT